MKIRVKNGFWLKTKLANIISVSSAAQAWMSSALISQRSLCDHLPASPCGSDLLRPQHGVQRQTPLCPEGQWLHTGLLGGRGAESGRAASPSCGEVAQASWGSARPRGRPHSACISSWFRASLSCLYSPAHRGWNKDAISFSDHHPEASRGLGSSRSRPEFKPRGREPLGTQRGRGSNPRSLRPTAALQTAPGARWAWKSTPLHRPWPAASRLPACGPPGLPQEKRPWAPWASGLHTSGSGRAVKGGQDRALRGLRSLTWIVPLSLHTHTHTKPHTSTK